MDRYSFDSFFLPVYHLFRDSVTASLLIRTCLNITHRQRPGEKSYGSMNDLLIDISLSSKLTDVEDWMK